MPNRGGEKAGYAREFAPIRSQPPGALCRTAATARRARIAAVGGLSGRRMGIWEGANEDEGQGDGKTLRGRGES